MEQKVLLPELLKGHIQGADFTVPGFSQIPGVVGSNPKLKSHSI